MSYPYGGINAVSLGTGAGSTLQGSTSIAIGYFAGAISQPASSIVLNASGTVLSGISSNALYVAPIRNATATNLVMYDTVNKEVVYSDTFNGALTANSIVSLTSLSTSTLNTSTLATNVFNVSTSNVQFLNFSTATGSTVSALNVTATNALLASTFVTSTLSVNVSNVSTSNAQFINFSTATGSTVSALNVTATNALLASTLATSTLSVNVSNVSTSNVQFINFSTATGSTVTALNVTATNALLASTLATSTLSVNVSNVSTSNAQFINFSTLSGSTMQSDNATVNSTMTISTLNVTNINAPGFSLTSFSTLTGSTLNASTVVVSSVNTNFAVVNSTLTVSTINASTLNVPGFSLTSFSTLTGSTLTASTVIVSSVNANFGVFNSTITVSTLNASSINVPGLSLTSFSTLTGSTLTASTVVVSSVNANFGIVNSTLTVSTLVTSTVTSQFINYSTLVGSTISTTTMYVSSLVISSITTASGSTISGTTGATGPAATTGTIGQISYTAGGSQSITTSASLAIVTWSTQDATQSSGSPGLAYNFGSNPAGTFTNITSMTLPVNIEYTLNLNTTSGGYSAIGLNGSTTIFGGTFNDTNGFSNSCVILVPAGGYFGIYYQDNATVTVAATSRIICTVINVGAGPTGPTGPQGQAIQASYAADGTQTGVFSSGTFVAVKFPTITTSQTQGTIPFTYNNSTGLFTNASGITQLVLIEYSLSLNTTGGGYSAIGLNGTSVLFGGMYNDSNFVSNSCSILVPNNQTIGLYYVDNAGSAVTVQSATAITITLINAGAQGPTGAVNGAWGTTGSVGIVGNPATYSAGYVGMGVGPTGSSFLQTTAVGSAGITGITGGTGSSIPQYPLDVAGAIRSAANQFMDGSAMISADSSLDYSTFARTWNSVPGVTLPSNQYWYYSVAMSGSGQYITIGGQTNVGIYYSSNYGQTWAPASGITTGWIYSIAMSKSGQYQIALYNNGTTYVYSSNYGQTWVPTTLSFTGGALCMSASGQYASMTSSTTSYYSTNYGMTWTASSSAIASTCIACSASGQYQVTANNNGIIYYSTNYGLTWVATTISNVGSIQPNSVAMSASGQYVSIPTNGTGVWYSTNYGQTFTNTRSGVGLTYISTIAMSASGQYQVCGGTGYIIFYSTDYGITWVRAYEDTNFNAWYGVTMSSNGQYCFGLRARFEPFLSVTRASAMGTSIMNGPVGMGLGPTGSSFLQTNFGSLAATGGTGSTVPQYTLDIVGSERVNGPRLFPDNSAQVTATPALDYNTFGINWAITNASITTNSIGCAVSATGQYQLQALYTSGGIYYSSNFGQSWTQAAGTSSISWILCAISASGQYALATGSAGTAIYVSSNFGVSWLPTSQTISGQGRCAISASGQYMIAGGGVAGSATPIYVSNNYGATWISIADTTLTWYSFAMSASGQYMYAGTSSAGNSIYISSNYGQSWTPRPTGFTTTVFYMSSSASGQYVCCSDNSAGTTYYSSTYGQTWTRSNIPINGPNGYGGIAMSASGQYVVTGGGGTNAQTLYYSTNYGQAWTAVPSSPTGNWFSLSMSANGQYLLAGAIGGSLYQSVTRFPSIFVNGSSQITGGLNLTGSVGIGTTAPTNTLTVQNGVFEVNDGTTSGKYGIYSFSSGLFINARTTNGGFTGNVGLCMNSSSQVGIGTSIIPTRCPLYVYSNVGDSQWEGRGYFGSATSGFVCGNYAGGVLIGGHNAALSAWANMRTDSNFGVGINPAYQFHVSTDSAAKPGTNTWTISSDERLKDSIILADNARCVEIIKAVPLKYYKWKDSVYTTQQVKDRSKLGWIAQDVEKVFPKAVGTTRFVYNQVFQDVVHADGTTTKQLVSEDVIEDCKDLNADQIYAVMYGAVQKLIADNELQSTQLATQATQLATQATQLATQATQLTALQSQVDQLLSRLTAAGIP